MLKRQILVVMSLLVMCSLVSCEKVQNQSQLETPKKTHESAGPTKGTLKVGYLICNSKEETVERFAPAASYIGQKLGYKIHFYPMHTIDVADDIKKYGIQFMKVNSIVYMQLKHSMDINFMLGEKRGPLGRFTTGTIIAKKGSGIKSIQDLKGKKFAFGPMFAPFGYLVQYDMMLNAGFDPDDMEKGLAYYAIPWGAYKHDKAIYFVQVGAYDVGSGPMLDLLSMAEAGKIRFGDKFSEEEQDFEIIAESKPAPYCTFASTKDADPELAAQIKKVLLELKKTDVAVMDPKWLEVEGVPWDQDGFLRSGEVLNVCKSGKIDGYEDGSDSDYDVLREMAKNVGLDPYPKFE